MGERTLEGRAALVTGGGSGQGRAIALALAERGADVAVGSFLASHGAVAANTDTHHPSEKELAEVASAIESHGARAVGRHHEARSDESCQALFEAASSAFSKVDILVNAAGITVEHPMASHNDDDWHRVIDVNLNGAYRMTKRCLPGMVERGWGRIVNIASTAANVGALGNAAYCASKSGMLGLTRCVALEGAPHGVTCNAICPGFVETEMMWSNMRRHARERGITYGELHAETVESYPQKRLVEPEEIAALAAFLCSGGARGITAEAITVACGSLW